ncbi:MAG: SDR family oxidoreductase [Flavobacteriaceae bacterium]|nr:SDR family oxidoreductase [Flavobacteriaceae bacterium]
MILVTGGTGLVGSHLLYHLLQEESSVKAIHQKTSDIHAVKKVFSYYTEASESVFNKIIWLEAELNDVPALEIAFKDVTQVYHCAAFVSFDPADYKKMRRVNIDGTTNIVNLCISNNIQKLCFVSSIATVEKNTKSQFIDESENWNSSTEKSGYAISKYGAEMEIWRASQEGVDVVIVNPGVILGSGFWHKGTGKFFTKINHRFPFYTEGITGFVGVKDVVKIMKTLMQSSIKNERFILVAENISYKDMFGHIADGLQKNKPNIKVSKFFSELFWRLDLVKSKLLRTSPLLTKTSAKSSQTKTYYSADKIETALNYQFESMEKVIQRIAKDFIN